MPTLTLDTQRDYRRALGTYPTGVAFVTTQTGAGAVAITVNSFTSVSLAPPLILWSIANASDRFAAFASAERWALSVLHADQQDLAARFATKGATHVHEDDLHRLPSGMHVARGALAHFECRTEQTVPAGDHLLILGAVESFDLREGQALTYCRGLFGAHG